MILSLPDDREYWRILHIEAVTVLTVTPCIVLVLTWCQDVMSFFNMIFMINWKTWSLPSKNDGYNRNANHVLWNLFKGDVIKLSPEIMPVGWATVGDFRRYEYGMLSLFFYNFYIGGLDFISLFRKKVHIVSFIGYYYDKPTKKSEVWTLRFAKGKLSILALCCLGFYCWCQPWTCSENGTFAKFSSKYNATNRPNLMTKHYAICGHMYSLIFGGAGSYFHYIKLHSIHLESLSPSLFEI